MKISYRKNLQISSVRSEDTWNKIEIYSFIQDSKILRPLFTDSVITKFLSSKNKLIKTASELYDKEISDSQDANNSSFVTAVDNLPQYSALRLKYFFNKNTVNPNLSADVSKGFEFVKLPENLCTDTDVKKQYDKIMLKQLQDYRDLKTPTENFLKRYLKFNTENRDQKRILKNKTADILEYLLPLGLNSRVSMNANAGEYIEIISKLKSSNSLVENEIGELMNNLLKDESHPNNISSVINDLYPSDEYIKQNQSVLDYLSDEVITKQRINFPMNELDGLEVSYVDDAIEELITHYEYLINPLGSAEEFNFTNEIQLDIGNLLFDTDSVNSLKSVGMMNGIRIHGMMSLALVAKFLNTKSLTAFIPFFEDNEDFKQEIKRKSGRSFFVPQYLRTSDARGLRRKYEKRIVESYKLIKKWRVKAKECMSEEIVDEFTKYLLPNAHSTSFFFYVNPAEFENIVNSKLLDEDANIDEKMFVYEVIRLISIDDLIWKPLLRRHIKPDVNSKFN
jgi:thymidylate synthase ThyX